MLSERKPELIRSYDARGDYVYLGQIGNQIGELNFYEGGLILGKLTDVNDGGVKRDAERLVLGVHSLEDGWFVLEKFARLSSGLPPIYWSFKPETPGRQLNPAKYQGIFTFGRTLSLDNFQIGKYLEEGIPEFDVLMDLLNLDTFQGHGDKGYRELIERDGQEVGNTGSLVLTAR